jgi:hypothetical protein
VSGASVDLLSRTEIAAAVLMSRSLFVTRPPLESSAPPGEVAHDLLHPAEVPVRLRHHTVKVPHGQRPQRAVMLLRLLGELEPCLIVQSVA